MSTVRSVTIDYSGVVERGSIDEAARWLLKRANQHIHRADHQAAVTQLIARLRQEGIGPDWRTTVQQEMFVRTRLDDFVSELLAEISKTLYQGMAVDLATALGTFLNPCEKEKTP